MTREQFVDGFTTNLYGKIPEEALKVVQNELFLYVQNYDLEQRETAVGQYTGYLPECYKVYFVSRKIEGLSTKTLEQYQLYLNDFFLSVNKELEEITANDIREKALIEFLYSSGARVTEACTIKISEVDFDKREVLLFGKGSKHRKSYISAKCALYLTEYLKSRTDQSEQLFVSERRPHGPLKKEAIERIIRNLGKRSGIGRDLFPHLFRHTVATDMLQKSVPVTNVQRMLGHVSINTTMVYAKVKDEDVKNNHHKYIN